jgi:RNA polymerase sigma-70 factor (ECF subfamily)
MRMTRRDPRRLQAARAGDERAVAELLHRELPRIRRFSRKLCRDAAAAEDVSQETLLAMARGLGTFREAAEVSTWLYAIARSFSIRSTRGGPAVGLEPIDSEVEQALADERSTPEEDAAAREAAAAAHAAIAGLAPMYRQVIVFADVEGLSAPAIAGVLGIGVAAVKSRLHRARLQVRAELMRRGVTPPHRPDASAQ